MEPLMLSRVIYGAVWCCGWLTARGCGSRDELVCLKKNSKQKRWSECFTVCASKRHLALQCMIEMWADNRGAGVKGWSKAEGGMQDDWQGNTVSAFLAALFFVGFSFLISWRDSYNGPGKNLEKLTKTWQSSFPLLFFSCVCTSQTPVWSNVCVCVVCTEYVYLVPVVKNSIVFLCWPMLMRLGRVGDGEALLGF